MTETFTPPQPPGVHHVTTQLHGDGCYYATCTCGWHSPACHRQQDVLLWAGDHRHQATPRKKSKTGRLVAVATAVFALAIVAAAAAGSSTPDSTDTGDNGGPKIYSRPGWTVNRAADLQHKLMRDGGLSKITSWCVVKGVAEGVTWLDWSTLTSGEQLVVVRGVEDVC